MLLFARPELPEIELQDTVNSQHNDGKGSRTHLEFFTLKDISIRTATLARPTGDRSIQAASRELRFQKRVNFRVCRDAVFISI